MSFFRPPRQKSVWLPFWVILKSARAMYQLLVVEIGARKRYPVKFTPSPTDVSLGKGKPRRYGIITALGPIFRGSMVVICPGDRAV